MSWQSFEYIPASKYTRILNMAVSEYARVTQGSKYATIWLNMSEADDHMREYVWI